MMRCVCLCLLLFMVGCSPRNEQPVTPTGSMVPHILPTQLTVPSIPPSTHTSSPSKTPTRLPTSTLTPSPIPTHDLVSEILAAQLPELYASYPSPDGMWQMDILIYNCIKTYDGGDEVAYEQLVLVDLASGEEQAVDQQLQYCGGLGAYGFAGRFWSPNSRYFYYSDARQGVPDGCGYWDPPFSRLDVANRQSERLGMGTLSPDGTRLATWDGPRQTLSLWDVDDGEMSRFAALLADAGPGPIIWSPDSQSLVYIQVESWCPVSGKSYLVQLDLATSEQNMLLESEHPTFADAEWDDTDVLSLFDEFGSAWRFDLITSELTPVP